jgi:4-alpha-glucanotransferase
MDTSYLNHCPAAKQWDRIGIKPHHGINIPLFSIHSNQSHGIGEFNDLLLLIDWAVSVGMDVIQLLPLNDTGHGTSPYSAISAFALNPFYLSLAELPHLEKYPSLQEELALMPKHTHSGRIDYQRVREHKKHFLIRYCNLAGTQHLISSSAYQAFLQEASFWIKGYAAFRILKKKHGWTHWESWPGQDQVPSTEFINQVITENQNEFHRHCLVQFLCDMQMKKVYAYANQKNLFIMGDIPILIDRDSTDVWIHRQLFDLNYSAGAPPDLYATDGQNWGFPIYDWERCIEEDFSWWKHRLRWSARYYHIYRIDHVVGFFRLWSIPIGHKGYEGSFLPKDERTWIDHGQRIMLMMVEASLMLPIGEDLGVVPDEVRTCLGAIGICGTRVMRWERKWKEQKQYIMPCEYQANTLTTVSTHDSETLQQWWANHPDEALAYSNFKGWTYQPVLSREYHREILWDSHHTNSLFHINLLPEYLALIPGLCHPDINEERINIPGIVSDSNWTYRLRPSLEELCSNNALKHLISDLLG